MQSATHFRKIPNPNNPNAFPSDFLYVLSYPGDSWPYIEEISFMKMTESDTKKVMPPPLMLQHLLTIVSKFSKNSIVGEQCLQKYIDCMDHFKSVETSQEGEQEDETDEEEEEASIDRIRAELKYMIRRNESNEKIEKEKETNILDQTCDCEDDCTPDYCCVVGSGTSGCVVDSCCECVIQ